MKPMPGHPPICRVMSVLLLVLVLSPAAQAVDILGVEPSLVSTAGGTPIAVLVQDLGRTDVVAVGGKPLTDVGFDPRRNAVTGKTQSLAAGFHDVTVVPASGGRPLATLPRGVEAAPPPAIISVEPQEVSAGGGTRIAIVGRELREITQVRIGTKLLIHPRTSADGRSIEGMAPGLEEDEPLGGAIVTVQDVRGISRLPDGVVYVEAPPPGPEDVEGNLAEGTARFEWRNPVPYEEILVLDADGRELQRLPGDAKKLELPTSGTRRLDIRLVGKAQRGILSALVDAIAAAPGECERPQPLLWGGYPGELNLSLRGDHPAAVLTRCAPQGGGASDPGPRLRRPPEDCLGRGRGGATAKPGIGHVVPQEYQGLSILQDSNRLITGFTLDSDADKLEISAYYEKIATDFGLELRCRLFHVWPDDGFRDEFTLPDVLIHQGKQLNSVTYFRADKDIGHPGDPDDPDPAKQPPKACGLTIPAGDYRLEFYAVGGESKVPYYIFADDPHDNEILIQGVPCPPYPLVKVTDVTGLRTLPDIVEVQAEVVQKRGQAFQLNPCQPGEIRVRFTAFGFWTDETNQQFTIDPCSNCDPPYVLNPSFEYRWTIHDRESPAVKSTGPQNGLSYCVKDWGCYKVEVEVLDKKCGFSKKRSFEVAIVPRPNQVQCAADHTFLYPTPDPGGIYAILGLNSPNAPSPIARGTFKGKRPVSFRVLAVPDCYCEGTSPCEALSIDSVEFRLVRKVGLSVQALAGTQILVEDLCPNVVEGAKYFAVTIEDIGQIPPQPSWQQETFYKIYFQGRKKPAGGDPSLGWRDVNESNAKPLRFANRPDALATTFWSGHFDEADSSYHFVTRSSRDTEETIDIGPSKAIDLGLPGVDVGIPSYDNDLSSGFTSRFQMQKGIWSPEVGAGTASGRVLSNSLDGAPVEVVPSVSGGGAGLGAGDGDGAAGPPVYEWCDKTQIFSQNISQTLFESILYSGTIGPIPVTIWASIGLGLDILVESYTTVFVSPFGPVEGSDFVEAHFYLLSSVDIAIPCEVRADVVGGLVSIALRLIPEANFRLDTHVWAVNAQPAADLFAEALMSLTMVIEGCVDLLLAEACVSVDIPIFEDVELLPPVGTDPRPPITCSGGGGSGSGSGSGNGGEGEREGPLLESGTEVATVLPHGDRAPRGGGGDIVLTLPYISISAPVTVFSPDRESILECTFDANGISTISIESPYGDEQIASNAVGQLLNPAAAFVSNTAAIMASTAQFCSESGLGVLCNPGSDPPPPPATLAEKNLILAQQEIVINTVGVAVVPPSNFPRWTPLGFFRLSDPPAEVPDPAARRPDGMATLAADLSEAGEDPPGGQALVAWVRYDGDYLKLDGTKTIYTRNPGGAKVPCPGDQPGEMKLCSFSTQVVDNIRPQMELSSIYVRRVSFTGLIPGEGMTKISTPGINIEPHLALSPSGQVGYCVWVHDPSHTNLIDSNQGRFLRFATYSKTSNTWSFPQDAVSNPDDYPGILDPVIALKDEANGLLAFTSLKKGAQVRDSGLGGNRFVYAARLIDGVFGEPFLIHGQCQRRVNGWSPTIHIPDPILVDPLSKLKIKLPDWVMVFQGTGPVGSLEGSGNVTVTSLAEGSQTWTPPINLMDDGDIHSNVAAALVGGTLRTLSVNGGPAQLAPGAGGGGAFVPVRHMERLESRLEPDLAIGACTLSDNFPAPGKLIRAKVQIENLGLADLPLEEDDTSAVGLEIVLVDEDARERVVARALVPPTAPAESRDLDLSFEMPLDPVRLIARLNPNPIDRDPTNDSRDCLLGAPKPEDVSCLPVQIAEEDGALPAVQVRWRSKAIYDEVLIYRDGLHVASVPGSSAQYVDLVAENPRALYEIRGRIGASKSERTACRLGEPTGPRFRRGDANDDGGVNISDPSYTLGFLFLGSREPPCLKAADSNDDGIVNITDPIYTLSFLFLGGPEPPAPGYLSCGRDPSEDTLTCAVAQGCP